MRCFLLAYKIKPVGIFSSPLNVWRAMEKMEGFRPSLDSKEALEVEFEDAWIHMKREDRPLNYSRFIASIQNTNKVRFFSLSEADENGVHPWKYQIWIFEMNGLDTSDVDIPTMIDEDEENVDMDELVKASTENFDTLFDAIKENVEEKPVISDSTLGEEKKEKNTNFSLDDFLSN